MPKVLQIIALVCINYLVAYAQEGAPDSKAALKYQHYSEQITPFPTEDRFEILVEAKGRVLEKNGASITIPLHGTEQVEGLKIYYRDVKGKQRNLKGKRIMADAEKKQFYETGYQALQFQFPSGAQSFYYSFNKKIPSLLLLAQLPLFAELPTDTLSYQFHLPENFRLNYDYDRESHLRMTIDSSQADLLEIQVRPRVCLSPKKVESLLRPDFRLPYLQVRLVGNEAEDAKADFLEDYWAFLEPTQNLAPKTLAFFKELSVNMSDSMQMITVFKEVRNRVRYVKDPNDIQAILPEKVEEVWRAKWGDCKDMSNLLYTIYKGLGFETYLLLTKTREHHFQGDFPSLGAFNHLMVLVRLEGKDYFMDATGPFNLPEFPISAVQGQRAVALEKGNYFDTEISIVPKEKNLVAFNCEMDLEKSTREGFHGFFGRYLFRQNGSPAIAFLEKRKKSRKNFPDFLLTKAKHSVWYFGAHNFRDSFSSIRGEAHLNHLLKEINGEIYLPLEEILIFPHLYPRQIPAGYELYFPHTINNQLEFTLGFKRPVTLKIPLTVNYSKQGMGFTLEITQKEEDTLYISYSFTNNNLKIGEDLADAYHEINELVKQTFKTVLLIE